MNSATLEWVEAQLATLDGVRRPLGTLPSLVFLFFIRTVGTWTHRAPKPYSSDAALFEIACYHLFQIDEWLSSNHVLSRQKRIDSLVDEFLNLFSSTFKVSTQHLRKLFNERWALYSRIRDAHPERLPRSGVLVKDKDDPTTIQFHLCDLVLRSEGLEAPASIQSQGEPKINKEHIDLARRLAAWDLGSTPTVLGYAQSLRSLGDA